MGGVHTVTVGAPAKINLGLRVLERRTDGFHEIETVLVAVTWSDKITIEVASGLELTCSVPDLPTDERNLCLRAARLLSERLRPPTGARIHLEKRLPWGAGLGSGSSDAATTLTGLCRLWDRSPPHGELMEMAAELGSDVPFFIEAHPALAEGRGERLTRLDTMIGEEPFIFPYTVAIAVPAIHISTADAYATVTPARREGRGLAALILDGEPRDWRRELTNDFEPSVLARYPHLRQIKEDFYGSGAAYASLSGSGSAVYALFEHEAAARAATERINAPTWVGDALV
jgi:4-diphosphocytidyl-2-C-methyl-D-erythritol kinase